MRKVVAFACWRVLACTAETSLPSTVRPTYSNSIIVSLSRRGTGSDARNPREFWEERIEKAVSREEEGEEKEEDGAQLEFIDGIGERAFWEGTAVGGALYVLKGDAFLRISVGTFGDPTKRKENVITLARHI